MIADDLARWAADLQPTAADLELADRALLDTLAVALAARSHPVVAWTAELPDAARWAAVGHVLDFDDLHMPSTAHISVVGVPAALAVGGGARAYLAGAGVMARVGAALGWGHYARGWHATCTAGALGAAVAAGVGLGLPADRIATAIALAVPAAGGVQAAFGSGGKSLQVGFAAEAGVRAARLAAAGATADPAAVEQWIELLGGAVDVDLGGPAIPGGLAIKVFPCCYALQRPMAAVRSLGPVDPADVAGVVVRTPAVTLQPLAHDRPTTGLEGKFSLPHAIAAALLDPHPGFASFTDEAVRRPEAQRLASLVAVDAGPGGDDLLAGVCEVALEMADGSVLQTSLGLPPGAPGRPPSAQDMAAKVADCGPDVPGLLADLDWTRARAVLQAELPGR